MLTAAIMTRFTVISFAASIDGLRPTAIPAL
jgi:hypothetical protein